MPVPQAPSPSLTQSNPNLSGQQHHGSSEVGTLQCQSPAHRCLHSQGPAPNEDNVSVTTPGKCDWKHHVLTHTSLHVTHREHHVISHTHTHPPYSCVDLFLLPVCSVRGKNTLSNGVVAPFPHTVHSRPSPADACTPPNQKSRVKKKASKSSAYRRDMQGGEWVKFHISVFHSWHFSASAVQIQRY